MNRLKTFSSFILIIILCLLTFSSQQLFVQAQDVDALNQKIEEQRQKIRALDLEIEKQRQAVLGARGEKQSIQSVLNELEASRKKILTDIKETEHQITKADLTIQKLGIEITDKEQRILNNREVLASTIKELNDIDETSPIEIFLTYESMGDFWDRINELQHFSDSVGELVDDLDTLKGELGSKQKEEVSEKEELKKYTKVLTGERESVEQTKSKKAELLTVAANKEKTYQQILDEKVAQKIAFEAAMNEYESQLKIVLNKDAFVKADKGVLAWPIDPPVVVTQQFGGTEFAKNNPQVYGRPFHNGTDLDLEVGDRVMSAASGTVRATGNTDAVPGCYSWGKWVLVDHTAIGLTTLYAHLSSITVSAGQKVNVGDTIGLGGNTGYSTGSHLHFTLYATQGVQVQKFEQFKVATGCAGASTPVAPHDAYLDPMVYLPKL